MKNEALREYFDTLYEVGDKDFLRLLSRFAPRSDDAVLMAWVLKIYDRMMGKADPYGWAAEEPGGQRLETVKRGYERMMAESWRMPRR